VRTVIYHVNRMQRSLDGLAGIMFMSGDITGRDW
jgi:hypothetical protein